MITHPEARATGGQNPAYSPGAPSHTPSEAQKWPLTCIFALSGMDRQCARMTGIAWSERGLASSRGLRVVWLAVVLSTDLVLRGGHAE